jgi:hypothetical protein
VREHPKDASASDKVISLLPWDITVRRARSRKHAYDLPEKKDADETIRSLTESEVYYAVKELGLESAIPMLAVVEPQQIRALIDLDIWHGQRADLSDLLLWLSAFREASITQLSRAVRALDPELLALLLRRRLLIALRPDEEDEQSSLLPDWLRDPPEDVLPLVETPDSRFIIAARKRDEMETESHKTLDEEERKAILDLVETLYKDEDFEFIAGVLRTAEADLSSGFEEEALRFRTARLEDLGFVPHDRARELYAPLDPREVLPKSELERLPAVEMLLPSLHAQRYSNGHLLEVLETIESADSMRRIEAELLTLSNAALVAEEVEPGDLERIRGVLDRVRGYLELALSFEAEPSRMIEIGRERMLSHSMRTLFRVGFGITFELGRRARRLKASGSFSRGSRPLDLLPERERALIDALVGPRPVMLAALEDPTRHLEQNRPIRTMAHVALIEAALDDLENLALAAEALGLGAVNASLSGAIDPPLVIERNADMLMATAAAQALLGRGFVFEPLDGRDLVRLASMVDKERFVEAEIDRVLSAARLAVNDARAVKAVERRVREGLRSLAETLAPLAARSEIDPRFVGTVVRLVG